MRFSVASISSLLKAVQAKFQPSKNESVRGGVGVKISQESVSQARCLRNQLYAITHTCTNTHTCTHIHYVRTPTRPHARTPTRTHTRMHSTRGTHGTYSMHTRMHTRVSTHTHVHTCTPTHSRTHLHTHQFLRLGRLWK